MATHSSAIGFTFLFVLVAAFAATCFAAIAWEKAREDPDFPGQCMWEKRNGPLGRYPPPVQMFQPEESWDIGDCVQARCIKLGDELFIQYVTCGAISASPPCIVVPQNISLPYPECCPRPWCPEPPPQPVDSSVKTNEIEKGGWEDDGQYQNLYQLFF